MLEDGIYKVHFETLKGHGDGIVGFESNALTRVPEGPR